MTTLYLNPQYTGPSPTSEDDVTTSWGSMTFDTLAAKTLHVAGGTNVDGTDLTVGDLTVDNGGTLTVQTTSDIGTLHVGGGARVTIAAGTTIQNLILDNNAKVTFAGGVTVTNTFSIDGGSHLDVKGFLSVLGQQINVYGDISYVWDADVKSGSRITHDRGDDPCYLEGTMISMADGTTKLIEHLDIDDVVTTTRGPKKVTFIGKHFHTVPKDARIRFLHNCELGRPVIIKKSSFPGFNLPFEDLRVTPEHMIVLGGKLVPVRLMVNDSSIVYDMETKEYAYYHFTVEGGHAIIYANGLASETFFSGNQDPADRWYKTTASTPTESSDKLALPLDTDHASIASAMISSGLAAPVAPSTDTPHGIESVISLVCHGATYLPLPSRKGYRFITKSLQGQRVLLNTPSVRIDTVIPGDDRRYVGFRGRILFLSDKGEVTTVETSNIHHHGWKGWFADGWSSQFPTVTIPDDCVQLIVDIDERLVDRPALAA